MYNVMFVCTANICRTPIAKAYFNMLVKGNGLSRVLVATSAGTWAQAGQVAAENSRRVCEEHGINCEDHQATPITLREMKAADLVLCMGKEHKKDLASIFPHFSDKIFLLSEYGREKIASGRTISDPFGRNLDVYRKVYVDITRHIDRIFPLVKALATEKATQTAS